MKCLLKNLLGLENLQTDQDGSCKALPPLVVSLVGSTIFVIAFAVISHIFNV